MKTLLLLLSALWFNINLATAQQEKFILSTNVLNLAALGPSFAMSYNFSPKLSIQAYTSMGKINLFNDYKYQTAILDFKFYKKNHIYFSPYLRYIHKRVYQESVDSFFYFDAGRDFEGSGISTGLCVGRKFKTRGVFSLEAFGGLGYGGFVSLQKEEYKAGFLDARVGLLTGFKL